jgi:hypothetical protein
MHPFEHRHAATAGGENGNEKKAAHDESEPRIRVVVAGQQSLPHLVSG